MNPADHQELSRDKPSGRFVIGYVFGEGEWTLFSSHEVVINYKLPNWLLNGDLIMNYIEPAQNLLSFSGDLRSA